MALIRSKVIGVVIHHDAVNNADVNGINGLKQRATAHDSHHRANSIAWNNTTNAEHGYSYIRYHYLIAPDGAVLQTQDEKYSLFANGDGANGQFNRYGINICFTGFFHAPVNNTPTEKALASCVKLIREIEARYKINAFVRGHRQLQATACPGDLLFPRIQDIIKYVNDKSFNPDSILNPATNWKQSVTQLSQVNYRAVRDTFLQNFVSNENIQSFPAGSEIKVAYGYNNMLITQWSYDNNRSHGFLIDDFEVISEIADEVGENPITEPITEQAPESVEKPIETVQEGDNTLIDVEIIDNLEDLEEMEKQVIHPKTIGQDLKSFAPYGASAQFAGAMIGTIVAYQYQLPVEVALAVAGLSGFLINGLMIVSVKLLDRLD